MAEVTLKDSKTNRDCIKIWNYIGEGVMLRDLHEAVYGNKISDLDNFSSNLVYCIHKLHKLGCIEAHVNRDADGRFGATVITKLKEPVIEIKLCSRCQKIAPNKSHNAKYKDICHECTKEIQDERLRDIHRSPKSRN